MGNRNKTREEEEKETRRKESGEERKYEKVW